ncbi:MAG: PepSY domain-containing protein, partial [Lewinella sp.]
MRFHYSRVATLVAFLLSSFALSAQKPMPDRSIAFGELTQKAYDIQGWNRVDATTGAVQVMYKSFYRTIPGTPEVMARDFLNFYKDELALTSVDLEHLEVHGMRTRRVGTTVRFHQQWEGVPVHGGEVSLTIKPDRSVVMVNNSFVQNVDLDDVTPSISADRARAITLDYLNTEGRITDEFNDLKIVATNNGAKLAYRVSLVAMEPLGEWEAFVDAKNGEILRVTDIAAYHKHRTEPAPYKPFPTILVEGTGNVWVPDPLSSAGADYGDTGFSDNNDNTTPQLLAQQVSVPLLDITLENGMYFLNGPWCEITDEESPNRGVFEQASNNWDFDRDDNAFEAVNVYYHIDESMRYLNDDLGIDVRPTDYSSGVRCDPSGLDNSDNSWYIGGAQRLAWGDGGVDDAEDSDVIHHELGHGLHDWITMGGLSQQQGLSEGCGDYWAASYNRSLGDWTPADEQYFWVFNWDGHNEFWNGRNCGVSTTWAPNLSGGIHT